MDKVNITFTVPSEIAQRAQAAGLLTDDALTEWLTKELAHRQKVDAFFDAVDQLTQQQPPLSMEEIQAEIDAYRAESD